MAVPDTAPGLAERGDADGDRGWHFTPVAGPEPAAVLLFGLQGPIRQVLSAPVMQSWMTVFVAALVRAPTVPGPGCGAVGGDRGLPACVVLRPRVACASHPLRCRSPVSPERCCPAASARPCRSPVRSCAGGVTPAAALAFLLSAPAINPIVLTATAVAFPGDPAMVLARALCPVFGAVGGGSPGWTRRPRPPGSVAGDRLHVRAPVSRCPQPDPPRRPPRPTPLPRPGRRACWSPASWAGCGCGSVGPTGYAPGPLGRRGPRQGQFWESLRHDVIISEFGLATMYGLRPVVPRSRRAARRRRARCRLRPGRACPGWSR